MMRRTKYMLVLLVILALSTGTLHGTVIEINITAEITGIDDRDELLEGQLKVGDIITGSYTYDSSTPDSSALDTVGAYHHSSSSYGISLSAGGFVFETDPNNVDFWVEVTNNHIPPTRDGYLLRSYNNLPLSNGVEVDHIFWQLDDYSGTALSSDALPTTPPVLEDWIDNYLHITCGFKGVTRIGANVTAVELVPEPATLFLLGLGGLALLTNRRFR